MSYEIEHDTISEEELQDLPEELLKQLSKRKNHTWDGTILYNIKQILDEAGKAMNIDCLLVWLYRKTKKIHKRHLVQQILTTGCRRGLVIRVGRGFYCSNKDLNQRAKDVVDSETDINEAATSLGRLGGLKGGKARAESLTPERRKEIATEAAKKRWRK